MTNQPIQWEDVTERDEDGRVVVSFETKVDDLCGHATRARFGRGWLWGVDRNADPFPVTIASGRVTCREDAQDAAEYEIGRALRHAEQDADR